MKTILLQIGEVTWLDKVIKQLQSYDNEVVLLSDFPYKDCECHDLQTFGEDIISLSSIYHHLSGNSREYELRCIARWFFIRNFLRSNPLDRFFVTDSDVMYYCNLFEKLNVFAPNTVRATLTGGTSAGIGFFNDSSVIEDFCERVELIYSGKDAFGLELLKKKFQAHKEMGRPGGCSDMDFWRILRHESPGDFGATDCVKMCYASKFNACGYETFDHHINTSSGVYHMKNGRKDFFWRDGEPYCLHERMNEAIRFNCIHYQGATKHLI